MCRIVRNKNVFHFDISVNDGWVAIVHMSDSFADVREDGEDFGFIKAGREACVKEVYQVTAYI